MVLKPPRAALAAATVTTVLCGTVVSANAAVPTDTTELQDAVTATAIMDHLAELQKIAGAGHWLHHDRLDEVLASLRGFLGVPQPAQAR